MADDDLTAVRLQVAEMKGMLSQALLDQGQRINGHDASLNTIHGRLSDKAKTITTHTEQIKGLEKAVNNLEQSRSGVLLRVASGIGAATGVVALIGMINNATQLQ